MILSDNQILEKLAFEGLVIDPLKLDNIEPASVDLKLGTDFKKVAKHHTNPVIDLTEETGEQYEYEEFTDSVVLHPNEFILATTEERIEMPDNLVGKVLGRSSLGRLGISVHQTAGYIDPGFNGQITLELSNHGPTPVELESGKRICQIVFTDLTSAAANPYGHTGSQYQNQRGATPSGMEFD